MTAAPRPLPSGPKHGTRVVREIDHEPVVVDGQRAFVRELVWNGGARSFDVYRDNEQGECLTMDDSFDQTPGEAEIRALLNQAATSGATAHQRRSVRDDKYAHLVQPQCLCGWHTAGFVTERVAEAMYRRHITAGVRPAAWLQPDEA